MVPDTLWKFDSLIISGTLLQCGSFLYSGTLAENDYFGYMAQLSGYEEAEKGSKGGFLAINKETGELALYQPQELDKVNIKTRISKIKTH